VRLAGLLNVDQSTISRLAAGDGAPLRRPMWPASHDCEVAAIGGMYNWGVGAVAGLNSIATCTVRGAISFNRPTHLPPIAGA
jgi:hypothetical protein